MKQQPLKDKPHNISSPQADKPLHGLTPNNTTQKALRYALLPGIIPQINDLRLRGFSQLSYFMALLYVAVRLIPASHPYANTANIGRYTMRDVIGTAAQNLKWSRNHIDQILVFGIIALGLILLAGQAILLIFGILIDNAWAQSASFSSLFQTPNPETDIAFSLLDKVFGVPGMFGSIFDPNVSGVPPSSFQFALRRLFALYSYAMLFVGVFIFFYYTVIVIAESAQTGVPFGSRFDSIAAPIRLVMALLLLLPLGYGLNSAQYTVLYAAKFGSSFATNGWNVFIQTIRGQAGNDIATPFGFQSAGNERLYFYKDRILSETGEFDYFIDIEEPDQRYRRSLIVQPEIPDLRHITSFSTIMATCAKAYEKVLDTPINAYFISNKKDPSGDGRWAVIANNASYQDAINFYNGGDIIIRYGHRDIEKYTKERGNVAPLCGEISFPALSYTQDADGSLNPNAQIQQWFYQTILYATDLTFNGGKVGLGDYITDLHLTTTALPSKAIETCENFNGDGPDPFVHFLNANLKIHQKLECDVAPPPDTVLLQKLIEIDRYIVASGIGAAYQIVLDKLNIGLSDTILKYGWAGAGVWYNSVAQINGAFTAAVSNPPRITKMPAIMIEVNERKRQEQKIVSTKDLYAPYILPTSSSDDDNIGPPTQKNVFPDTEAEKQQIAQMLNDAYVLYAVKLQETGRASQQAGLFIRMINYLTGSEGIFSIRENIQTHPLAQIASLGRAMIDRALQNLAISALGGFVGGAFSLFDDIKDYGAALSALSSMFSSFATISLSMGIVLYYIIPFLPFLSFFFAVITWIKSIFEAMVGVPLWALSHLRIQGKGLFGDAAINGYFLIFEIFLRPILILIGLLAATITFFVEIYLLHVLFDLAVANVAGGDIQCAQLSQEGKYSSHCDAGDHVLGSAVGNLVNKVRGQFDVYFYTVMYVILVYIMANSAFKLITLIPNQIIRWMGSSAAAFSESDEDPSGELTQKAGIAAFLVSKQLAGAVPGASETAGKAAGSLLGEEGANVAQTSANKKSKGI